jgi:Yip1 domain
MDESQPQLMPENPQPSTTSLSARMTNIFVSPSEVFDEVKASPPTPTNWIVPVAIAMIVGIIYSMVVFSQPGVFQHMKNDQEKKYQQLVDSGKMKQADVDYAREMTDKFMTPTIFKVVGILSSIFLNAVMLFLFALVIWLVGRYAFHGHFDYMKAVEVVGLSTMISIVGTIVTMLLVVIYGDMAMSPSLILLVGHLDPNNKIHLLLSAVNLMTLWWLTVMSIGLARLSGAGFVKAAVFVFGLWYAVWAICALGLPMLVKGK